MNKTPGKCWLQSTESTIILLMKTFGLLVLCSMLVAGLAITMEDICIMNTVAIDTHKSLKY